MDFSNGEFVNKSINTEFKKLNELSDQPIDFEKFGFLSMILRNLNQF